MRKAYGNLALYQKEGRNPHTLTEVQAKAATATEAGNKAYYVCGNEGCGKYFADSKGQTEITDKASVIIPFKGTEVKDKSGTTYKVTSIAANAFKNNKKISKVVIGNNIVSIGKNAFAGCKKLTSVTLGKNVKTIRKDHLVYEVILLA